MSQTIEKPTDPDILEHFNKKQRFKDKFEAGSMDFTRFSRHKSTSSLELLERKRAHLVKMTVPADPIIKTFNVIKHL